MRASEKRTPAGASAGVSRDCFGRLSRFRSSLEGYQAQILIAAHGVRSEWAAMLAAFAFGGGAA